MGEFDFVFDVSLIEHSIDLCFRGQIQQNEYEREKKKFIKREEH